LHIMEQVNRRERKPTAMTEMQRPLGNVPFETLLVDISARFVNLPPEHVDSEIRDTQRQVCECLHMDVSSLWQLSENHPGSMLLTHFYVPPGFPPVPEIMNAKESLPWCLGKMLKGESIILSRLTDAPAAAERDLELWQHYGVKSVLAFPLSAGGGEVLGALNFNVIRDQRGWPIELVNRLQLVAQIFANALARKRTEQLLRESEERLQLATDSAGVGLWSMELDTREVWVTAKIRELYPFAPDEKLNAESFLKVIHSEDRERVNQAMRQAVQSGASFIEDYRIELPDGGLRWIASRGRLRLNQSGETDLMMGASLDITERKRMEVELREQLKEIERLKLRLEKENLFLHEELHEQHGFEKIIGSSDALNYVLFRVGQVAPTDATVLILGETGTGKGMVARAIHGLSSRKGRPMITVNCAALPANLIESELFGREKGAFTGAHARQAGRFEAADRGTLFLDEIGEMPLELQSKLLRVLQDGEFERLGSSKTVKVDVRVIASTSRELKQQVHDGRFREDLYYRLNVFPVSLPPLRKRIDDIPQLVRHFVDKYARKMGKSIETIPKTAMKSLQQYAWPGNIRELEHIIERAVITTEGNVIQLSDNLEPLKNQEIVTESTPRDLAGMERDHILSVLKETGWKIEGPSGAASILKLHPSTLRFRIKKLNIRRPA
jgi:formate hydrogenlyase transcriptional activator